MVTAETDPVLRSGAHEALSHFGRNLRQVGGRLLLSAGLVVGAGVVTEQPAEADQSTQINGPDGLEVTMDVWCNHDDNETKVLLDQRDMMQQDVSGALKVGQETRSVGNLWGDTQIFKFPTPEANMPVTFTFTEPSNGGNKTITSDCVPNPNAPQPDGGYWMVDSAGIVYDFGLAGYHGRHFTAVDIEPTPGSDGYWIVSGRGQVVGGGSARRFDPEFPSLQPGEIVTSLSRSASGNGYILFTTLGRALNYGDAPHLGDMSGKQLNAPVVDSITTPSGNGYYMVAADGGVFTFGDAKFAGSTGDMRLNQPVASLVPDPDKNGYWLVASDGGVFAFDAPFKGSMGGTKLNRPITGMVPSGDGYIMVAEDGGIFTFGNNVRFWGSLGDNPPPDPIVAVAPYERPQPSA